ncbi:putative transcriptional regulatory protein [Podospora fimiseda]|uniref:Transcriptional regulatory protein n=1 Tax=Podospora fimiseda TaxID=252190 RepID=A0AAN6YNZ8_9PEZI|nr:putative transcriptional regulatory protein [Podospora fimiseda]
MADPMETSVASPDVDDGEDHHATSLPFVPRAASPPFSFLKYCNACRARKIGCNRESPCAHCVRAKIECTYDNSKRPREKRARILLTQQYEQKIDHLDSRLDEIVALLRDLKANGRGATPALPPIIQIQRPIESSNPAPTPSKVAQSGQSSAPTPASCHVGAHASSSSSSGDAAREAKSPMVEGDSSLTAQSVFANDFLQKVLNKESRPEMREGLDALHVIVEAMKRQPAAHEMTYPHAPPVKESTLEGCQLPPIQKTVEVLKLAQSREMLGLAWIYEFLPIRVFQDTCFQLYMSDEYNLIIVVIVNVGLHFLFWAAAQIAPQNAKEYVEYASNCGTNVEAALAKLPLHLPASDDTITALMLGAFYAVELSKPSLAWILCSKASELVQTLGYHRATTYHNMPPDDRRYKQYLFWGMYIVDKSLSLRLGRSSTIQEYDITLQYPKPDEANANELTSCFVLWCMAAKVQGQIYELLYCPEAMNQPEEVRRSRMHILAQRLDEVETKTQELLTGDWQAYASNNIGEHLMEFFQVSDHVLRLSILTLTYRAVPNPVGSPTTFSTDCIQAARQTLARHEECMAIVNKSNCGLFSTYMHWTILMAPFVPFIVIFCQVIETRDKEDLARLQAFVASLQIEASVTEAVEKLRRLFQVLYTVASRYVDSHKSGGGNAVDRGSQIQGGHQEVDAYLATLGFPQLGGNQAVVYDQQQLGAPIHGGIDTTNNRIIGEAPASAEELQRGVNPMMWMGNGAQLEDWFYNNQQMMALLEDGFLDPGLPPM